MLAVCFCHRFSFAQGLKYIERKYNVTQHHYCLVNLTIDSNNASSCNVVTHLNKCYSRLVDLFEQWENSAFMHTIAHWPLFAYLDCGFFMQFSLCVWKMFRTQIVWFVVGDFVWYTSSIRFLLDYYCSTQLCKLNIKLQKLHIKTEFVSKFVSTEFL